MSGSLRQDQPYRRGLVLGLTMAEIVILIIFCLLLALTAVLAARESRIKELEQVVADRGIATRLYDLLHKRFPRAVTFDDYFKELTAALQKNVELDALAKLADKPATLLEDAKIGAAIRKAAEAKAADPSAFAKALVALGAGKEELAKKLAETEKILASQKGSKSADWPPIINLSEAGGYFFETGRSDLKPEFRRALETIVLDRLVDIISRYDVNVVEVIGHTDEQPISGMQTNLDTKLIPAVRGAASIDILTASDNPGLGMARAVSVLKVLRADPRLKNIVVLPLSGGQLIAPIDKLADGSIAGDVPERRRIEIRVRRSTTESEAR